MDHTGIPRWTKLTTPNLMVYRIFFEVEEVLDEVWAKNEDELSQGYEEWMDFQHGEEERRDSKKAKTGEDGTNTICASIRTIIALKDRDVALKEQEVVDKVLYTRNQDTDKMKERDEGTRSTSVNGEGEKKNENETHNITTDRNPEGGGEASQSVGLGTKLGIEYQEDVVMENKDGYEPNQGCPRYSGRIASKNRDGTPILDRAMTLARAKNLALSEGEGGRKGGAATGCKAAGMSRR
ncbi:uncharacterized protein [Triticum aestivum]|uniref:uncharacterized protein n=1 Tax=Triticum aestivum TaxID=4565 RepID=UPI001D00EE09|nr:uncharacterized protein LOC123048829 [Triticum aestivum]